MLIPLCLLLVFQDNQEDVFAKDDRAIKIKLGSPAIDLPLISLANGQNLNFRDFGEDGFTFFFTPNCEYCKQAYELVPLLRKDYNCFVVFAGEKEKVLGFLKQQKEADRGHVFLVDARHLLPYNIVRVPAVIAFKQNRLSMAMHGPIDGGTLGDIVELHKNDSLLKKKGE